MAQQRRTGDQKSMRALVEGLLEPELGDAARLRSRLTSALDASQRGRFMTQVREALRGRTSLPAPSLAALTYGLGRVGFPQDGMVELVSAFMPGAMSAEQYAYIESIAFGTRPPLGENEVLGLAGYTYLDRKLLAPKARETAAELGGRSDRLWLLHLLLLAHRNDLNRENRELITMVLAECSPGLDVYVLGDRVQPAPGGGRKRSRGLAMAATPEQRAAHVIQKYFSDEAMRALGVRPVEEESEPLAPRPRKPRAARKPATPAASPPPPPPPPEPARRGLGRSGRIALAAGAAVAVVAAVAVAWALLPRHAGVAAPAAPAAAAPAPASTPAPAAAPAPAAPARQAVEIRPGDSIWRIYTQLRARGIDVPAWSQFRDAAQAENKLNNPDLILTGEKLVLPEAGAGAGR
jgi:hypothetical protein